jgi:uncharacterized protein (DUF1015 family)
MPEIQAFRGLRYDLGHVGALSDVVAPPYDVIDADLQEHLYQKHPHNVIRLILNRIEPADDETNNRYTRAARLFKEWRSSGVLQAEPAAALYVYHQLFSYADRQMTRRGFMARLRLERFGEGTVYPHEETHASAKADRLQLTIACKANLSQIFGLYPDPENEAQGLLEQAIAGQTPLEATDHLGAVHRLWPVTDVQVISQLAGLLSPRPMFVADGHHRYETACNYRDHLSQRGPLDPNHPANFVLTMFVSMTDPGLVIMPTHRLFRGLPAFTAAQLSHKLNGCFALQAAGLGPAAAGAIWDTIAAEGDQSSLALYTAADRRWQVARLTEQGRQRMAEAAAEHSADWRELGVSLLHRLIIDTLLGAHDLPKAEYVHLVSEVVSGLTKGDPQGGQYPLAALAMPATVDHVRAISEHGERMPAKSTYFYPKLLSGLVFHALE